jgi:ubiquinone biosynthesis protein
VRRLAEIARFGARVPEVPTYAEAFQEIGPAAIKLGQALATRPDLVGEERRAISPAPGQPAARPVRADPAGDRAGPRAADRRALLARSTPSRSAPPRSPRSIARSPPRAGWSRSRCCGPNIEEDFATAIETYEWAAAQVEAMGGEAARLGRGWSSPPSGNGPTRARPRQEPRLLPSCARISSPRAASSSRDRLEPHLARVLTLEWIDGIKLTDRDALVAAGHDVKALGRTLVRAFLRQAVVDGFFHADLTRAISSPSPTAGSRRSTSASWAGSTARRGSGWPRSSTA